MTYRHLKSYKSTLNLQNSRVIFFLKNCRLTSKAKNLKIFGNAKIDSSLKSKISIVCQYVLFWTLMTCPRIDYKDFLELKIFPNFRHKVVFSTWTHQYFII